MTDRRPLRPAVLLAGLGALALIALATLVPTGSRAGSTPPFCLGCGSFGAADLVANVVLFLPLGIVLGRAGWRPLLAVGLGLALSGAIEFAQVLIPGRAPTVRDVLMNGVGAGIGALLVLRIRAWLRPGTSARVLLWLALAGTLLAIGLTGALVRFKPAGGVLHGQWVPDQGHLERWSGRLRSAEVGGVSVPDGPSPRSDALRAALRDTVTVRLEGVAGRATRRISAIFAVMNDEQEEVLLVGPHGADLVVRVRRASASWRMDAPEFRYRGALAGIAPGSPLAIAFDGSRLGGCATVNRVRHCVGRPRAGSTWQLARSFDRLPPLAHGLLDLMTLVVLALPFGLLLRSAPHREMALAGSLLVIAFPIVAWWSGLSLPGVWEWSGVALALLAGSMLNARLRATESASLSVTAGTDNR